jgi:hypothetical protein
MIHEFWWLTIADLKRLANDRYLFVSPRKKLGEFEL